MGKNIGKRIFSDNPPNKNWSYSLAQEAMSPQKQTKNLKANI
jgi:hypothetical protein